MITRDINRSLQLHRLERVIQGRHANAANALQLELNNLHKIDEELVTRRATVDALKKDMLNLQQFLNVETLDSGVELKSLDYQRGLERRYWIDYDQQRENYYLELTIEEHKEQLQKVGQARGLLKSLTVKRDILHHKLRQAGQYENAARERKLESERQDSSFYQSDLTGSRE